MRISIYTGEEVIPVLHPNDSCTFCSELATEIVGGLLMCGIPGNHSDSELKQTNDVAA